MKVLTAQGETEALRNAPADPFTLFNESISDLLLEAENFLDGKDIENEEQEQAIASILTRLRREASGADDARKAEKKPYDDAGKAVQAKWQPLLQKADLAVGAAKTVLAKYLQRKEDALRAAAEAARQEAERQAAAARKAAENVSPGDLAGLSTVKHLTENAIALEKQAGKLEKGKAQAKGGERAVGLRSIWTPALTDPVAALKHYRETQPSALKEWLLDQARQDVRAGKRAIPGFAISEEKTAA